MGELLTVVVFTLVVTGLLALVAARAEMFQRALENLLIGFSTLIILFVLFYVLAEVVARYIFNAPLPGHLEGAELLLPMIVFLAVSFTQARHGHVGMTLVIDALPPGIRRRTDLVILVLSILTCAVLAYFGTKYAYQSWDYDDVTMSPPFWPVWPSAATVPLGYLLLALRMCLQALQIVMPERFPEPLRDDGMHVSD